MKRAHPLLCHARELSFQGLSKICRSSDLIISVASVHHPEIRLQPLEATRSEFPQTVLAGLNIWMRPSGASSRRAAISSPVQCRLHLGLQLRRRLNTSRPMSSFARLGKHSASSSSLVRSSNTGTKQSRVHSCAQRTANRIVFPNGSSAARVSKTRCAAAQKWTAEHHAAFRLEGPPTGSPGMPDSEHPGMRIAHLVDTKAPSKRRPRCMAGYRHCALRTAHFDGREIDSRFGALSSANWAAPRTSAHVTKKASRESQS